MELPSLHCNLWLGFLFFNIKINKKIYKNLNDKVFLT